MPRKQRKRICKHEPECEHFFVIMFNNKDIMLCEGETREFGESILKQANKGSVREREKRVYQKSQEWTDEDVKELKKLLKKDTKHGAYKRISKRIGREPSLVMAKVKRLRNAGEL